MIIYEVNLTIAKEIYQDYFTWLKQHVLDMCHFEGFISAKIFKIGMLDDESWISVVVHYQIISLENLTHYLQQYASQMRKQAIQLFGNQFKVTRRVLQEI